jgi:hypothetical protein
VTYGKKRKGSPYSRTLINEEDSGVGQANILTSRRWRVDDIKMATEADSNRKPGLRLINTRISDRRRDSKASARLQGSSEVPRDRHNYVR